MNRFHLLLIGPVILGLVGCGEPKASTLETIPPAASSSSAVSSHAGFAALQRVTDKTVAAVKAEKFDEARTEFEAFETSWKTVEEGVKAKSSDIYKKIEDSLDTANKELKQKQPDKTKVLMVLASLTQSIKVAANS